jgi:hypothetical protein
MGWWSGVRDSSSVEEERDSGGVAAVDVGVGAAQPQHVRLVAELANSASLHPYHRYHGKLIKQKSIMIVSISGGLVS